MMTEDTVEDQLWRHSAVALAAMIRDRRVSSREVVTSHLERIDEVNDRVNAVTAVLAESALAAAAEADAMEPSGALHGVPFTIKENIDLAGSATTQGLPALAEAMPAFDAPVVVRMKAAGAIPLARTNLPEMGLRITTDNPLHGRTLNPWDETRTAGGSSGGEGVALATGMSPIGLGNDIGGSLRNPAYCNGVTSLKPTTGRIPAYHAIPEAVQPIAFRLMAVEGPMARTVADLETAYPLLSGWDPLDPFSVSADLQGPPVAKKAGLVTAMPFSSLPEATVAAIERAGRELEQRGWTVEEVTPPELELVNELWARVLAADLANMAPLLAPMMSAPAMGLLEGLLTTFDPADMTVTQLFSERDRLAMDWSRMFVDHPVLVGPIWADLPFRHDADVDPETGLETTQRELQFITPGNLLGIPAVAVPTGVADGLPTGVQVYGERWREDLCLEVAGVIEAGVDPITPMDPTW